MRLLALTLCFVLLPRSAGLQVRSSEGAQIMFSLLCLLLALQELQLPECPGPIHVNTESNAPEIIAWHLPLPPTNCSLLHIALLFPRSRKMTTPRPHSLPCLSPQATHQQASSSCPVILFFYSRIQNLLAFTNLLIRIYKSTWEARFHLSLVSPSV